MPKQTAELEPQIICHSCSTECGGTTEHTKETGEPPPGQLPLTMQPALTSNLWWHWIQPEEGQTAD